MTDLRAPRHRILIDASPVTNSNDGLSVYIINLIAHLSPESLLEFDVTVLLNPDVRRRDLAHALRRPGITVLRHRIRPIGPLRDLDMWRFLRRNGHSFDLIHITSNNYPRSLRGGICTIHDVTFKNWFDAPNRFPAAGSLARFYLDRMIRHCLRRADLVIAVSNSTRRDIGRYFQPSAHDMEKVKVIYEGWEHLLEFEEIERPPPIKHRDYLFFLGSYRVHKNLTGLLQAFEYALDRIPAHKNLVVTGSSDRLSSAQRAIVSRINVRRERLTFTGHVPQDEIPNLYKNADALILPSFSEGFGLPILEAFHFGVPVIAADTTAIPEIAGDAAIYFDPFDKKSMAQTLVDFYKDPSLADKLRAEGDSRKLQFSWNKTVAQTLDLYRRVLKERRASKNRRCHS